MLCVLLCLQVSDPSAGKGFGLNRKIRLVGWEVVAVVVVVQQKATRKREAERQRGTVAIIGSASASPDVPLLLLLSPLFSHHHHHWFVMSVSVLVSASWLASVFGAISKAFCCGGGGDVGSEH